MDNTDRGAPEAETDGERVLVVDDERMIRGLLRQLLDGRYRVLTAESGAAALDVMERHPCQLALVDIQMPGMSGLELLQKINERFPDTAVIMVSGVSEVDTAVGTIRAGASAWRTSRTGSRSRRG